MGFGVTEFVVLLLIVVLLFGATRIPKLARSLGESLKELRKGAAEAEADAAVPSPKPDDKVTMTRADLDALVAEREARARKERPPTG